MLQHAARDASGIAAVPFQPIWTLPLVALLALTAFALGARDDVIRLWSGETVPVFVASEPGPPTMAADRASPHVATSPAHANGGGQTRRHGTTDPFPTLPRSWPAAWSGDIRSFFRQTLNLLHRPPPIDTSLASLIYDSGRGPAPTPSPQRQAAPCPEGGMLTLCRRVDAVPPSPPCAEPFAAQAAAKTTQAVAIPAVARTHCVAPPE